MNEITQTVTELRKHVGIGLTTDALEHQLLRAADLLELLEPVWPVIQPLIAGQLRQRVADRRAKVAREHLARIIDAVEILLANPNSNAALLDLARLADNWKQTRFD